MIKVNYLDSIHSQRSNSIIINITKAFELIKSNDRIKEITEKARSNKENYKAIKAKLPACQFQFCSPQRNEQNKLSGLLFVDIDAKDNTLSLNEIKNTIQDVYKNNLYSAWTTCSGQGLACLLKYKITTQTDYTDAWDNVNNTLQQCNITVDKSSRSIKQLCFLPHDSNIYVNNNAYSLDISPLKPLKYESSTNVSLKLKYPPQSDSTALFELFLEYLSKQEKLKILKYDKWVSFGKAIYCCFDYASGLNLFVRFSQLCMQSDNYEYLVYKFNSFQKAVENQGYNLNSCRGNIVNRYKEYSFNFSEHLSKNNNTTIRYINKYITEDIEYLKEFIKENRVSHVEAATGSGKSTAIIQACKELFTEDIIMCCPTILGTKNIAESNNIPFAAGNMNKYDKQAAFASNILVTTYDTLLQLNEQKRYNCIIIDEAHTLIKDYSFRGHIINEFENKIQKLRETNNELSIIYVSGTPCPVFLQTSCIKNIKYIQSEQQQFILTDYNYTNENTIIEYLTTILNKKGTGKILIQVSSVRQGLIITETLKKTAQLKDNEIQFISSNDKETDFFELLSKTSMIPEDCKILAGTSIIENAVSFENTDITHAVYIDSLNITNVTSIRQFAARARKVSKLNVIVFFCKRDSDNNYTLNEAKLNKLYIADYLSLSPQTYDNNTKIVSRNYSTYTLNNKVNIYETLCKAEIQYYKTASKQQIINELLKDNRFKLFDKSSNDSYYLDVQNSTVVDTATSEIKKLVNKNIKDSRLLHCELLKLDFEIYVSVVCTLSNQKFKGKEILKKHILEASIIEKQLEELQPYCKFLKSDYYIKSIEMMLQSGFNTSEIQKIISNTEYSHVELMKLLKGKLGFILYKHVKNVNPQILKTIYNNTDLHVYEKELELASKLKLNKEYVISELPQIINSKLSSKIIASSLDKIFNLSKSKKNKNQRTVILHNQFSLLDIEKIINKKTHENHINLSEYVSRIEAKITSKK